MCRVHKRPMANSALRQNDRINSRDSIESVFVFSFFYFFFFLFYSSIYFAWSTKIGVEFLINPRGTKIESGEIAGKKLNSSIDCELTWALTYRVLAARISPSLDSRNTVKPIWNWKDFRATKPRFVECTEFVTRGRARVYTRSCASAEEITNSDITLRNPNYSDILRSVDLTLF